MYAKDNKVNQNNDVEIPKEIEEIDAFFPQDDLEFIKKAFNDIENLELVSKVRKKFIEYISESLIVLSYDLEIDNLCKNKECNCGEHKNENKMNIGKVKLFQSYNRISQISNYTYIGNPALEPTHVMNLINRAESCGYH